jgi:hypothetical protein
MNSRFGARARRMTVVCALALAGLCAFAGLAQAAVPAWKLLALTGPTYLPPKQSEIQRVTVEADGGSFRFEKQIQGEGTPVVREGHLTLTAGSAEATITSVGAGASFDVGDRVTGPGVAFETTILSCSSDCATPGSTVTLSNNAEASEADAPIQIFTKDLSGVSGDFHVGDEIAGTVWNYFAPGTVVTAVGPGTLTLSKATTSEYLSFEGAIGITGTARTVAIDHDASAEDLQSALEGLLGSGSVAVSGGPGGDAEHPYFVEFVGPLAEQNVDKLQASASDLEGEHAAVHVFTTLTGGPGTGEIAVDPANIGGAETSGEYSIEVGPLPPGIVTSGTAHGEDWTCGGGAGDSTVTCTSNAAVPQLSTANNIIIPIEIEPSVASTGSTEVTMSGGGSKPTSIQLPIVVSKQQAPAGAAAFWAGAYDENGNEETQAGGHPYSAISYFMLNTVRAASGKVVTIGDPKNVIVDLPPGFAGNPLITPRCPQMQTSPPGFEGSEVCTYEVEVGQFSPSLNEFGAAFRTFVTTFQNNVPPQGYAAEFTTKIAFPVQSLLASVRGSDDYGIRITAPNNPNYARIYGAFASLEGFPTVANGKPFFRNPTECTGEPSVVHTQSETWQEPELLSIKTDQVLPPITGCDKLEFHPGFSFQPTNTDGSSGTGATAHLHIPQDGFSDGSKLGTPDLKKAMVTLPEGLILNPSSANGLEACSLEQIGYRGSDFPAPAPIRFDESAPGCPEASKLGTVVVETPLLEDKLEGTIYLAAQEANPFGSLLGIYLVVDDARTGITIKLPGKLEPNPATGQLTAVFDNNPQLPFEDLTLHFRGGGPRSELATPEVCGNYKTTGSLTPWSAPQSGPPAQIEEPGFDVSSHCASSPAARPFAPSFEAGTTGTKAGGYSSMVIKVNRKDGEQELNRLDFTLPNGLTGKLAGIPYCPQTAIDAAAGKSGKEEQAAPSCPAASRLGSVDTAAGVGPEPFHVGGDVYLAGPYKGAPVSTVVVIPAVAGPFDLGDVVVRSPLYVDPETAQLTVKSDPLPTALKGLPLKVRSVAIHVDRSSFVINPTNCEPMSFTASLGGNSGATATPSGRFQVGGCKDLKFSPKLKISLKGGTRRNSHPALVAKLTQPAGQANIGHVSVALPHSEFLDQAHIGTICTRVQFAAKECPKGSIYGKAEAITPLLDQPLKGLVYLRSSNHKLPDLVAALRGPDTQPVEIDLDGRIDAIHGGIRNTFEMVPDAPVSTFVLRMKRGKKGLLVNSTNICRGKHRATVRMNGQNGKAHNFRTPVKANCRGKKHKRRGSHR